MSGYVRINRNQLISDSNLSVSGSVLEEKPKLVNQLHLLEEFQYIRMKIELLIKLVMLSAQDQMEPVVR